MVGTRSRYSLTQFLKLQEIEGAIDLALNRSATRRQMASLSGSRLSKV
jgi:hypothetical protein